MTISNGVDGDHLRAFIERIEAVEQNIRDEQEARKEIYAELKSLGFDPKIVRKVVSMRKQDQHKREEEEAMLDVYLSALGDLSGTPLGEAAVGRRFGVGV